MLNSIHISQIPRLQLVTYDANFIRNLVIAVLRLFAEVDELRFQIMAIVTVLILQDDKSCCDIFLACDTNLVGNGLLQILFPLMTSDKTVDPKFPSFGQYLGKDNFQHFFNGRFFY